MPQARYFWEANVFRIATHNEGGVVGAEADDTISLYSDTTRTTLATTYLSRSGGTLKTNPLVPDATGRAWCYVDAGYPYYWACGDVQGEFFAGTDTFPEAIDVPTVTMDELTVDELTVNGPGTITGAGVVGGGLTVTGGVAASGAVSGTNGTFSGDVSAGDDLTVTDDASVGGDLTVGGAATVTGALSAASLSAASLTVGGGTLNLTSMTTGTLQTTTSLQVGAGGAIIQKILKGTATWDMAAFSGAVGTAATTTVPVTDAVVGDIVIGITHSTARAAANGPYIFFNGYVSAAGIVTVTAWSPLATGDPASGTITVLVAKVT
jgi:hypothetical protein